VPPCDLLIYAGDFMFLGSKFQEIVSFNEWLRKQPAKDIIVIAGNHDRLVETNRDSALGLLTRPIYLENSGVTIDGVAIWGSPVQPEFCNWAFNVARGTAIKQYWDLIPDGTDILITHGPPYGVLDQSTPNGPHLGCEELLKAVEAKKPKLHVFGHIHGGHGMWLHEETVGSGDGLVRVNRSTTFINAAFCDESYRPSHQPTIYEFEKERAK